MITPMHVLRNEKTLAGEKTVTSIEGFVVLANMLIIGGVGGYFIGYLLKRIFKVLLIGFGILIFFVASLAFVGTINVNYEGITIGITNLINPQQLSMILQSAISNLPLLASFAVGFLLGIGKQ